MRHNKSRCLLSLCLVALFTGQPADVWGASKQDELKAIERDIRQQQQRSKEFSNKSQALQDEVTALRAELIALSQSVQQREANVTRLELALMDVTRDEKLARNALEKRYGQSVDTLMALQRLALNPPEALIASPQDPSDMVRSAILLRSIIPHIQQQAETLRSDVETYAQKREKLESQKASLERANVNLDDERRRLDVLIQEKKTLSKRYIADSKTARQKMANLTQKAKDLRGLIQRLEAERKEREAQQRVNVIPPKKPDTPAERTGETDIEPDSEPDTEIVLGTPPKGKPISRSKGNLSRPAVGPVVMSFGQKEKLGGNHKGISIKTRNGAQIVATYDGQIAFAGPFRGYKQLLIIDHGDGYHTLLTGMDRIDVSVGQWLLSGEPVGVMSSNSSSHATLYFELRKNGAPINPSPWLRRQNAKARG
ncbi:murein hydrolase activator EnvC family protein [Terasakiella pusilla]|uniref:murein hydrolase activator EnvC family protein n=1 Tax=Terasakiella pusilla TaxID=64973 RepID=UPI003AA8D68B